MSKDTISNSKENETVESAQILGESELEEVAGGASSTCRFVPEVPTKHTVDGGTVWVKCSSSCGVSDWGCSCRGKRTCIERWHEMEKISGNIYSPFNVAEFNHAAGDKAVHGLVL